MKSAILTHLAGVKLYRFGRISISTFMVGRCLLTGRVET